MANLLLVRRLEVMSVNWRKTTTQKGAKKSVLETLMKFNLDILIAHISNYFCRDSKVCMQFLSDDDYQLNNTVPRQVARPKTVPKTARNRKTFSPNDPHLQVCDKEIGHAQGHTLLSGM